jgi:hypothetical protein
LVAAAPRPLVAAVRGGRLDGGRRAQPPVEIIELAQLRRELQLELRRVEPLRLRGEQPPAQQRQLVLQVLVGEPQVVVLDRQRRERRLLRRARRPLGRELRLKRGDPRLGIGSRFACRGHTRPVRDGDRLVEWR